VLRTPYYIRDAEKKFARENGNAARFFGPCGLAPLSKPRVGQALPQVPLFWQETFSGFRSSWSSK
jgi:hypothetical protein